MFGFACLRVSLFVCPAGRLDSILLRSQPPRLYRSLYMADPFSLTTGIISLITLAIKLVAGAAGMIDKTITAHREAANELQTLQWELEQLDSQMDQIHNTLQFLATNTKDRTFKKLLQEWVPSS